MLWMWVFKLISFWCKLSQFKKKILALLQNLKDLQTNTRQFKDLDSLKLSLDVTWGWRGHECFVVTVTLAAELIQSLGQSLQLCFQQLAQTLLLLSKAGKQNEQEHNTEICTICKTFATKTTDH